MSQPAAPIALACLGRGGSGQPTGPRGRRGHAGSQRVRGQPDPGASWSPPGSCCRCVGQTRWCTRAPFKKSEYLGKAPCPVPGTTTLPAPGLWQQIFSSGASAAPGVTSKPGEEQPFAGQVAEPPNSLVVWTSQRPATLGQAGRGLHPQIWLSLKIPPPPPPGITSVYHLAFSEG